jgi:hypothetical protein
MNTMSPLQIVDQGVDARGIEGVASHKQGLDRKSLPEFRAAKMTACHLPDCLVIPQAQELQNLS